MTRACHGPIRAAIGDQLSDEEIEDLVGRLAARARRKGLADPSLSEQDGLRQAVAELTAEDLKVKLIAKRMETFALLARSKRAERFNVPVADLAKSLIDFNVGSSRLKAQTGLSVDARGRALGDKVRGELVRGLEGIEGATQRLGNWLGNTDRDFEADVARELSRLNGGDSTPSVDPMALSVAKVLKKAQDQGRTWLNDRGAWVADAPGYVTKQNHDAIKVSGGFKQGWTPDAPTSSKARTKWRNDIEPLLDGRTFEKTDEGALNRLEKLTAKLTSKREKAGGDGSVATDRVDALGILGFASEADLIKDSRSAMLDQVWIDIVLGKSGDDGVEGSDLSGFMPPAGVAKQVSRSRVLHFKSPDDWMMYHRAYGSGSFLETLLLGLEANAKKAALMEAWGPNPRAAFDAERKRLAARAEAAGDITTANQIMNDGRVREFSVLDGTTDGPQGGLEARVAKIGQAIRVHQSVSKLGGMTITSISDMGSAATALARAGVPLFHAYGEILEGVSRTQGADAAHVGDLVNVTARSIIGDVAGNFATGDTATGLMSRAQQIFYKVNLFDQWQTGVRRGASTALARLLGGRADRDFKSLGNGVGAQLERYGIDSQLWDLTRKHVEVIDGEPGQFLTPDMAAKITADEAVAWSGVAKVVNRAGVALARDKMRGAIGLMEFGEQWADEWPAWTKLDNAQQSTLSGAGMNRALWERVRKSGDIDKVTDRAIAQDLKIADVWTDSQKKRAQEEAQIRWQAWFSSFVDDATTEPRAAEKAILTWGARDGTALGTVMRMLTQFKSFPLTMITRNILPTLRETNASIAAMQAGEVGVEALGRPAMMMANTLVGLTVLGYVAGAARDLLSGKEARPLDAPETYLAAFIQGGGAGFYGDFLFGQYNRFGQGPLSALAGPSVGTVEQIMSLYGKLRDGDDGGAKAFQLGLANMPFANLFYLRGALNYGMLYQMQEAASPGYLDRMEKRMQEKEGRGFWLEPAGLEDSQANN